MRTKTRRALVVVGIVVALVAAACSESADDATVEGEGTPTATADAPEPEPDTEDTAEPAPEPEPDTEDTAEPAPDEATDGDDEPAPPADDGSIVSAYAGQEWFLGEMPSAVVAADESLDPIVIGMINQEDTPLGSFPEMRGAADAAVTWINTELGGVGGRPIRLETCITSFSVEQSQACAQELVQAEAVAILGGIDVTSNGSFPVLEQNGIPVVGGIPANLVEQRSELAFYFSGGGVGSLAGYLAHAAEQGATSAMIAYGEFESFEVAAVDYGAAVGESLGLEMELVSFPITSTDFLPVLTKAQETGVDAVIIAAADSACVPVMQTAVQLELEAQLYMSGGCAAEEIIDATGPSIEGVVFNSEGPTDPGDVDGLIYQDVVDLYATIPAGGAGTVGFRGAMNLYDLLLELGPEDISAATITDLVRAAEARRSFWGHPYTCDGNQVPGMPALCAPQQQLFGVDAEAELYSVSDGWIDTVILFQNAV